MNPHALFRILKTDTCCVGNPAITLPIQKGSFHQLDEINQYLLTVRLDILPEVIF
jgi:hypothetical protein